jgi:hypothetical protein
LAISWQDLIESLEVARLLVERRLCDPHIDWDSDAFLNSDDHVLHRGLSQAVLIAYARPFIQNQGTDLAKSVLPAKYWRNCYDEKDLALHEAVISLRNQSVAHSDATVWKVGTSKFGASRIVAIEEPPRELAEPELRRLSTMVPRVLDVIDEGISELLSGGMHGVSLVRMNSSETT